MNKKCLRNSKRNNSRTQHKVTMSEKVENAWSEVEMAWDLYLFLERNIERSFEFVYPLFPSNKNVVSIPYQQFIFSSCSGIENLLTSMMEKWNFKPEEFEEDESTWNINLFYKALAKKGKNKAIKDETVFFDYQLHKMCDNRTIKPFKKWEENQVPTWWTVYNKIKHDRSKHIEKANLYNVIRASSGFLVLIKNIALELKCPRELISGTKLMHAYKMPRYGATYTEERGGAVRSGGWFPEANPPCIPE